MTQTPTLLAVLLDRRGLGRYGSFAPAYEKAARSVDPKVSGGAPSRAQFHRWTKEGLRGLPYTDHCRVLEHMLTGYSAAQLFQPCPDRKIPAPERAASGGRAAALPTLAPTQAMAGVEAVFASRSEFATQVKPQSLIDGAPSVRAAGFSLNLICQQLPDQYLTQVITTGDRAGLSLPGPGRRGSRRPRARRGIRARIPGQPHQAQHRPLVSTSTSCLACATVCPQSHETA
jgi:hypothetical protein